MPITTNYTKENVDMCIDMIRGHANNSNALFCYEKIKREKWKDRKPTFLPSNFI